MSGSGAELVKLDLPEFSLPTVEPSIPPGTYEARIREAYRRADEAGHDGLAIYADREHFANLAYLTGYDPRFEESLLILIPGQTPTLLVGNEGMGYSAVIPIQVRRILYQTFSLLSQPRSSSAPLRAILRDAGLRNGQRIGVVGWKYFLDIETDKPARWIEIPAFIVDTLHELGCDLFNANDLFMHPETGLRAVNDVDQLACFEFSATHSSQGIRDLLFNVRPGMTEYDAVRLMRLTGMPTDLYPLVLSGERAALAPASPSSRVLVHGDPMLAALGYWGSNTARGGFLVSDARELPIAIHDYVDKLVIPYFLAVAEWYEQIGIGVAGHSLYDIVARRLGDPFFGVTLNPGHLIHLEEWLSSPIYQESTDHLQSGMALQVDVIPATNTPYHTTNIEDGIALADEPLRNVLALKYPEAWQRIQQRRAFVQDVLGIHLKPEVLPFSNIPAYLPPYWLSPDRALRLA